MGTACKIRYETSIRLGPNAPKISVRYNMHFIENCTSFPTYVCFQPSLTAQRRSLETYGRVQQVHRNSRHISDAAEEEREAIVYNPYVYKYLKHRRRKK